MHGLRKSLLWVVAAVVLLALAVFFYPKYAGSEPPYKTVHQPGQVARDKYDCTGFLRRERPLGDDMEAEWRCYGWVGARHCYAYNDRLLPVDEVPCPPGFR